MSNKLLTVFNGATINPLASVPWVAQWKFNNDGNDSIGANTLTNNNSATFTTGKLGGATGATQLVAASSQYWSITDNASLRLGNQNSYIAVWVYLASKPGNPMGIITKRAAAPPDEYQLTWDNTADKFQFVVWNGLSGGSSAAVGIVYSATFGSPSLNTWYLVECGVDVTNNRVYIGVNNGTFDYATLTGIPGAATDAVNIGNVTGASRYWNGRIDNLCMATGTNAIASSAVRAAIYNSGNGTETLT